MRQTQPQFWKEVLIITNTATTLSDIATRSDIETLVRAFYASAMVDEEIGYFFTQVIPIDLEEHVPKVTNFWENILLNNPVYSGSPMQKHLALHALSPLQKSHFNRWLEIWTQTVDRLFSGQNAALAKARAQMVARSISMRIEDVQRWGP